MASQELQKTTGYLCSLAKYNLALLALSLVLTAKFSSAQTPGTRSTFGSGGKVTTDFGGSGAVALTVAVQVDGKILARNQNPPQFPLASSPD